MGFSVSGSAALIFAAMILAFGMWHTAAANGFERVDEAQQAQADSTLDERNTEIVIDRAFYDGTLYVDVTNEGSTTLSLNATDLLVDNDHVSGWQAGALDQSTDLWLPGEQITIEYDGESSPPARVKLATEHGVTASSEVST